MSEEKTRRILLLEDNDGDADLVGYLLSGPQAANSQNVAFEMARVATLAEGLERLSRARFDVVLLDLGLPDSSGVDSVRTIMRESPQVPLVILTGLENEDTAMEAVRAGAQDYLNKNQVSTRDLVRCLLYAMERHRRIQVEHRLRIAEAEARAAGAVQRLLLPARAPAVSGFDIAGRCQPALQAGGDYIDYFPMQQGRLGIITADVSGHDLAAAILMAGFRRLLRTWAEIHEDVGKILTLANGAIAEDTRPEQFVTGFFAQLDPSERSLRFAAAGHQSYLLEPSGEIQTLSTPDPPLGVLSDTLYGAEASRVLLPGQVILLLTDGFYEAENVAGDQWELDTILGLVHGQRDKSASEIVDRLFQAAQDHLHPHSPQDDMAAVIVKVED